MMGLIMLMFLAVYVLISIWVVRRVKTYARANGKSATRWGWGAALGMYMLVFWDWIPTVAAHKYYCETQAGFWVYKTPEQWKQENPGVMEELVSYNKNPGGFNVDWPSKFQGDSGNYTNTNFVNQRFNLIVRHNGKLLFNRWRHEQELVDSKTSLVLARYVDFSTSQDQPEAGWVGWKFWLYSGFTGSRYCSGGRDWLNNFGKFYIQFKGTEK